MCPDLDADGDVDVTDLLALLAGFGQDDSGDVNGDGETNVTDLLALLAGFGADDQCSPGASGSGQALSNVAFADIKMNTCYYFFNADGLSVKWHEKEPNGQCHNGKPLYATEGSMEATSDKFKFVPALCHGGQCGGTNTGSAQSGGKVVLLSRFALSASR